MALLASANALSMALNCTIIKSIAYNCCQRAENYVYDSPILQDMVSGVSQPWVEYPTSPIYSPYNASILDEDYFQCVSYDSASFSGYGDAYPYKMWH